VRFVDDIWVSGHLARAGVLRFVVPAGGLPLETRASGLAALTYGVNKSGENDAIAIRHFAADWRSGKVDDVAAIDGGRA